MKLPSKSNTQRAAVAHQRLVGRLVPIRGVPEDVTELHQMMHGGADPDFTWAWTPRPRRDSCYFRPPGWPIEGIYPIRIQVGLRSQKWRWFWVFPPNTEPSR